MNGRWQTGRHTSGGGSIQRYLLVIAPGESIKANGHHFIFVGIWNSYIPSCMQRHKASVWENTSGVLLAWLLVGTKTTSVWEPEMHWCVVHCPSVFSLRESRGLLQGSHAQQKRSAGRSCCLGFSRANSVRIWISRTCHWRLQNLQKSLQCTSCLIEFCFGKSGDTSCWQEQSVHCAMRYCQSPRPEIIMALGGCPPFLQVPIQCHEVPSYSSDVVGVVPMALLAITPVWPEASLKCCWACHVCIRLPEHLSHSPGNIYPSLGVWVLQHHPEERVWFSICVSIAGAGAATAQSPPWAWGGREALLIKRPQHFDSVMGVRGYCMIESLSRTH